MRRAAIALVLIALAGPAHAASFSLSFLMPTIGDSLCNGTLRPLETPQLKGHWRWWVAGGDSLAGAVEDSTGIVGPGVRVDTPRYTGIASTSLLRARAWATYPLESAAFCDTVVTFRPFVIRPWHMHKL